MAHYCKIHQVYSLLAFERIKCILTMNMLYEYYFQDEFPPFRYLDFVHIKRGTYSFKVDYR